MSAIHLPAWYYNQFDADYAKDVPAEGYGGWKKSMLPLESDHTAIVVMHAWDCGTKERFPGVHRGCEYLTRSYEIAQYLFPDLLSAVRLFGMKVYHIVERNSTYYREYPGYRIAVSLIGETQEKTEKTATDPVYDEIMQFRNRYSFPGEHNKPDFQANKSSVDFLEQARPLGNEGIAESSDQLHALCKKDQVNHLIYTGFAINDCLQNSPGGMVDMSRHGYICSTIRQAVTAVENKETARNELAKEVALWQVALFYGLVYDAGDFITGLRENVHYDRFTLGEGDNKL